MNGSFAVTAVQRGVRAVVMCDRSFHMHPLVFDFHGTVPSALPVQCFDSGHNDFAAPPTLREVLSGVERDTFLR